MCSIPKAPKMPQLAPPPPPPAPVAQVQITSPYEGDLEVNQETNQGQQKRRQGFQSLRIQRHDNLGTGL